ncbi:L-threonylcarbamoyladenylate synthase [Armatimonas rosea]|uniref:Threonylcarbamoyl-AMP synthase n=1 Tax=Armatimonas rosea TaxID=685828 RepID=A0A7W9SL17_ARMRO|nr:L-threonylcarbamoyladenylate synthase [Armatimonas rosea]MBB6048295.1 L-threonylcarbamoyladenylate synthase [Armatimonas rosea]
MSARIALPEPAALAEAAERLRAGELVAFPTETVYGLGANALDAVAVAKIYTAKGRPATNPLIVHVASVAQAKTLVKTWPALADELAAAHWPGPLTLVLERANHVPDSVTAGGPTVGIRIPSHPVALELLRLAGVPVAAPSANRSEEISPTRAQHVADSLGAFVDDLLILDGGACDVGIESTVLDVTCEPPRVLRPGMCLPPLAPLVTPSGSAKGDVARSPGQMLRHYAPKKPTLVLGFGEKYTQVEGDAWLTLPATPEAAAQALYVELRRLDSDPHVARIVLPVVPDSPEWDAIRDRLRRAATPRHE